MTAAPLLLIWGDDAAANLAAALTLDGFEVQHARSAGHARALAVVGRPALAVLGGLGSPRGALDLLVEIRACVPGAGPWDPSLGVIALGGLGGGADVLRALDCGADDFVERSAGYPELRARLRALQRRACRPAARVIDVGPLSVDPLSRICTLAGRELRLRRMEFELLLHLAREPERVFGRGELLRTLWAYRSCGATRTVDTHACRLRSRLGGGAWVVSVRGVGYRLR